MAEVEERFGSRLSELCEKSECMRQTQSNAIGEKSTGTGVGRGA